PRDIERQDKCAKPDEPDGGDDDYTPSDDDATDDYTPTNDTSDDATDDDNYTPIEGEELPDVDDVPDDAELGIGGNYTPKDSKTKTK
ncbi:MAG: hypothetical protein MPL62_11790, partial [Alphaproteobacteria bacterium]|nr:hypothetical protein [Alphaproteobacteria bacterium]